jgi:hypothetical protein
MKKENRLPEYWIVQNDGSQLFKDTVLRYVNNHKENKGLIDYVAEGSGRYYGIDCQKGFYGLIHNRDNNPTLLTLQQFIDMTTELKQGDKVKEVTMQEVSEKFGCEIKIIE